MFTIKETAEQLGVSSELLRAWERRYGVVAPARTPGGYRLYSDADLAALRQMAELVAAGRPPRLAADQVRAGHPANPTASPLGESVTGVRDLDPAAAVERLLGAARALDGSGVDEALTALWSSDHFEEMADLTLLPALRMLGERWCEGTVSVAGEHLTAHAVMRRLAAEFEAPPRISHGPRVLVGLPPGSRHEVGPFAFAVAARRAGLRTDYLGADLPLADWRSAVQADAIAAVVVAVATPDDVAAARAVHEVCHEVSPATLVLAGGAAQAHLPAEVIRLGHEVGTAAQLLRAHLAATPA